MNRIAAIFLTLTFVLYLGGMQLMYWVKIDNAKRDATATILRHSAKAVDTKDFSFTTSQYNSLSWLDKNKEFIFDGQHYDIAGIEYLSGSIKVSCYNDNEETEIANAFQKFSNKLFSTHQQSNSSDNDVLSKITKEYLPLNPVLVQPKIEKSISIITKENTPTLSLLTADIWHPPSIC
jgi:hypothetical protein